MTKLVAAYLEALERSQDQRTRSPERIRTRLANLEAELASPSTSPVERLRSVQERIDLEAELRAAEQGSDLEECQAAAIEVMAEWADLNHVTYAAFRELGVPAAVLKAAGVTRRGSVS